MNSIGECYRGHQGDTRSLDYRSYANHSTYGSSTEKIQSMDELFQQLGLHITVTPRIKG